MAIDFSKIDVIADVSNDIRRMVNSAEFYEKVVKEAAKIHIEDARQKTDNSKSPSGGNFQRLKPEYASKKRRLSDEPAVANLRYGVDSKTGQRRQKAMKSIREKEGSANREATIYFDDVTDGGRIKAGTYMDYHQRGVGQNAMRKIFPEDDDMRSPAQSRTKSRVAGTLQFYLMTPRTITIG